MTKQGKIFLAVFLIAAAFIIFRAHYYSGFPLVIAFLCVLGTAVAGIDEIFWNGKKQGFGGRLIMSVMGVSLLVILLWLNESYCSTMLARKTEVIDSRITRSEIRTSKGHSTEYLIYEYVYKTRSYSNEIRASETSFKVGDEVKLKVCCLDPTVSIIQN